MRSPGTDDLFIQVPSDDPGAVSLGPGSPIDPVRLPEHLGESGDETVARITVTHFAFTQPQLSPPEKVEVDLGIDP